MTDKIGVLLVCTGNICRSPTAEGVLRKMARESSLDQALIIDSAGTYGYHAGEGPDPRARAAARRRGYDLSGLKARVVESKDFDRFAYVLAMDREHLEYLQAMRPSDYSGHLGLLLDFAPKLGLKDIPDPYYGGPEGFERVLDLVEQASSGLLAHLRDRILV